MQCKDNVAVAEVTKVECGQVRKCEHEANQRGGIQGEEPVGEDASFRRFRQKRQRKHFHNFSKQRIKHKTNTCRGKTVGQDLNFYQLLNYVSNHHFVCTNDCNTTNALRKDDLKR